MSMGGEGRRTKSPEQLQPEYRRLSAPQKMQNKNKIEAR